MQLEVFAQHPSNDLTEIHELARNAREDAGMAVGAVKDIESRISAFESQEPSRMTDDQLVALTALAGGPVAVMTLDDSVIRADGRPRE